MDTQNLQSDTILVRSTLTELPALFSAAPHRMMFFAGASAVMITMLWWALYLTADYTGWLYMPSPPVPAGAAHALLTQYGMLPMFMFGFLLTVFPRWMNQVALRPRHYVPVFVGVFGGYLLAHVGLLGSRGVFIGGLGLMLAGWCIGLYTLGSVLMRHGGRDHHALSCWSALLLGAIGLAAFLAFTLGASPSWAEFSIKLGTFGLLLPVYFTVCHRMIPFFSVNVAPAYHMIRPRWSLPLLWLLLAGHLGLVLGGRGDLAWICDLPLALFFAGHWLAWQPWKCHRPGLLAALYLAFAWLPVAFALFSIQSLAIWLGGNSVLGHAPLHALTVGFFGSMLVAMVTRVTQGHSGRPLEMGPIAWLCFALLQAVALARIWAELANNTPLWLVIAAGGWLLAFLPWVARGLWIYLTPRVDGRPG